VNLYRNWRVETPQYTDYTKVESVVLDLYPPKWRTATGYGDKVPTPFRIKYEGHWRRVYMIQWSNVGTPYILCKKNKLLLDSTTEYLLTEGVILSDRENIHLAV